MLKNPKRLGSSLILLTVAVLALVLSSSVTAQTAKDPYADSPSSFANDLKPVAVRNKSIVDELGSIPLLGARVTLFSVKPQRAARSNGEDADTTLFHDHIVLGSVEIRGLSAKMDLIASLFDGIRGSDGSKMFCFNPRHGIRIESGDKIIDLLICFRCLQVESWGLQSSSLFATTAAPASYFNSILSAGGIPIFP